MGENLAFSRETRRKSENLAQLDWNMLTNRKKKCGVNVGYIFF